jgi:hypothetical protein
MKTIYASFDNVEWAKQAAGALLDKGAKPEDLSLIAHGAEAHEKNEHPDKQAKEGITVTTPKDAASAAVPGAGIGLGVGILAALAAIAVPGVGLVIGGGALAVAIAGAVGATAAGAISGGALGYLKDQGVDDEEARKLAAHLEASGAILGVHLGWEGATRHEVVEVLNKYQGRNVYPYERV